VDGLFESTDPHQRLGEVDAGQGLAADESVGARRGDHFGEPLDRLPVAGFLQVDAGDVGVDTGDGEHVAGVLGEAQRLVLCRGAGVPIVDRRGQGLGDPRRGKGARVAARLGECERPVGREGQLLHLAAAPQRGRVRGRELRTFGVVVGRRGRFEEGASLGRPSLQVEGVAAPPREARWQQPVGPPDALGQGEPVVAVEVGDRLGRSRAQHVDDLLGPPGGELGQQLSSRVRGLRTHRLT